MGKCDNCRLRKESAKAFDIHWHGEDDCPYGKCPVPDFPKTNADRIRSMTDEELAEFESERMCCPPGKPGCEANNLTCDNCEKCWLDWLKQEATDG